MLQVYRKFGVVELVYSGEENVSFVVKMPSGKIEIFLPYDSNIEKKTSNYGAYQSSYGAYQSGYSFISENMVKRKKNKQFATFTPKEKGKHEITIPGTKQKEIINL